MDIAEIRKLVRVMREHGILELEIQDRRGKVRLVRENGAHLETRRAGRPGVAVSAANGPGEQLVAAPMVGTFHRGPGPGAPPFVEPGVLVEVGQVLGVIEAMKIMNEIAAEMRGRVLRILVQDGAPVEYGAPLLVLEPV
jgi:acetyl-CoA carboxylase biotin carboxyl carrier protein